MPEDYKQRFGVSPVESRGKDVSVVEMRRIMWGGQDKLQPDRAACRQAEVKKARQREPFY